jgi:co-chaperonin GroES (HSP10)
MSSLKPLGARVLVEELGSAKMAGTLIVMNARPAIVQCGRILAVGERVKDRDLNLGGYVYYKRESGIETEHGLVLLESHLLGYSNEVIDVTVWDSGIGKAYS